MYYAPTLESILRDVDNKLVPVQAYPEIGRHVSQFMQSGAQALSLPKGNTRLIGILFSRPAVELAKSQITEHLGYYHERTGKDVDVYCCGYGGGWPPGEYPDQDPVAKVNGLTWYFSNKAFNELREEIEAKTSWQYSGRSDLMLLGAGAGHDGEVTLGYSCALVCQLEQLIEDQAITSVENFMEEISRFARKHQGTNAVWNFSDHQGGRIAISAFKNAILDVLPQRLRQTYSQAEHMAVRDISRRK